MKVYNYTTRKWENISQYHYHGIIILRPDYIEYGYFTININSILLEINDELTWLYNYQNCNVNLYYRNDIGAYSTNSRNLNNIKRVSRAIWPYPIEKYYNFSKLNLSKPDIEFSDFNDVEYNFTIGVEYETCRGNIPWLDCLKYGLVPLYDGSITGHEYVTFPLQFQELDIIAKHLSILNQYTEYDKNCSLHIHFGNFPISYNDINKLVRMWETFQFELLKYLPYWSYAVENYKDNRKAYNKPLKIRNLKTFYSATTGNTFTGEECFYYANSFDQEELRKWEVQGRYYNMNIMHLLSGVSHKTVEFRFLRPTTNYLEVKWYILILSAFLQTVINVKSPLVINVPELIEISYKDPIKSWLHDYSHKLYALHKIQMANDDYAGINNYLKNIVLNEILFDNRH